jgi:hypothetical protein
VVKWKSGKMEMWYNGNVVKWKIGKMESGTMEK